MKKLQQTQSMLTAVTKASIQNSLHIWIFITHMNVLVMWIAASKVMTLLWDRNYYYYYLHWLPIKQRIKFKLCLLVHKSLIGHSPAYISDLLTSAADVPGRPALRTASHGDFIVPRTNRKFGDRAFCVAAPRVWNRLPADLRQLRSTQTFRRHLKTFLFAASYWAPINRHSWTM